MADSGQGEARPGTTLERTGASDRGSARRYQGAVLEDMRNHYWPLQQNTRQAATDSRDFFARRKGIELPTTIELAGKDAWLGDVPGKLTIPQRVLQKAIAKDWEIKRSVTTGGYSAASVSSRIEQPLIAIMRDKKAGVPWDKFNDLLLNEALAFGTVSIAPTDRMQAPSLYEGRGPDGKDLVAQRFRLDGKGRLEDEEGYEGLDLERAERAANAERHDYLARRLPFRQDAYSIRSCAPIWGARAGELDGLIVESYWTSWKLEQQGVTASKDKAGANLYPLGALDEGGGFSSAGNRIKIIEAWLTDSDGMPYISRHAAEGDAKYLWKEGKPWTVDLSQIAKDKQKQWRGLTRLPITFGWGLGWPAADPDERGMTFIEPYWRSWRNIDSLLTSMIVWCMWRAFPPLIEKVPLSGGSLDDGDKDKTPDIQPLKITRVTGDIIELGTQGIAPAVGEAISLMRGEILSEAPGQGSDSANSGFQASLNEAFEDKALTTVGDAALGMVGDHASFVLEGAKLIGECYEPIRVYKISEVLIEQKNPSDTRQLMVLDPALIGSNYDIDCIKKIVEGENPTRTQQNMEKVERQLMSQYTFLEREGNPSPEAELNRIKYEQISNSEQGQAFELNLVTKYVDDEFISQLQEAIAGNEANQQGLPNGYSLGTPQPQAMLPPGVPAQGGAPGLGVPDPAASALAATVGAGLQTGPVNNALQAGGVIPENLPGMTG